MHCPWCHNPETLAFHGQIGWETQRCLRDGGCARACPTGALDFTDGDVLIDRARCRDCGACVAFCPSEALIHFGKDLDVDELLELALCDRAFYEASHGGVTLSGGEPMAQPDAALELLRKLKVSNVHTATDTCGISRWTR